LVSTADNPNILLIVVDALRARNLGCYGYPRSASSNIDNLAKEGVLFEDAFSCANVTDASLTTIFSGKYPLSHGILRHGQRIKKEEIRKLHKSGTRFLPQILKKRGYTTLAVDWLGRWHRSGFDYYSNMIHHGKPIGLPVNWIDSKLRALSRRYAAFQMSTTIDNARAVTARAENLIATYGKKRFFLFLHYWDTHTPYGPSTDFYEKIGDESANKMIKGIINLMSWRARIQEYILRYNVAIAYIDHEIGKLMKNLETQGLLDQTLIILTSDHGESLTEHGIFFAHKGLYDVTIHVPLIFRYSDFPKNERIKGFVQHFDILPTITNFLDIEYKEYDGKNALPLVYGETKQLHSAVYAEEAYYERKRAIRTINYKYINALSTAYRGSKEELYDLNKDSEETQNIIEQKPEIASALRTKATNWIKSLGLKENQPS